MEQKKLFFQKLTPTDEVKISVYEEAIDFVFANEDITNIAISGPYSAGKSSVIESYKKIHQDYKFVHISLAHFEDTDKKSEAENEKVRESVLEGKILNQLIHQIPVERIPQTNFRVKRGTSKTNIVLITILLCSLIGSAIFLSKLEEMMTFINGLSDNWIKNILSAFMSNNVAILMVFVLAISCVISIYNIVKLQQNKNLFHKLSVQGNEIEIFESQDESYFDKYLNEVLYLFEQVEADVIVFEDMDRFNANSIFERLREVNNLTNIQRKNKASGKKPKRKYKPLRFFYLLRDDIFETKDRTKFFDYIVPVVPVIDGSNAYDQFARYLKQGGIFDGFDASFLQRLSLYIDDMRVLKNIYNEFVVYINRLDNTSLNWNKMLAMIVYKNLFPRDFSNLQLAKGYVHQLFEEKANLRKETICLLEEAKKNISDSIKRMNEETLCSVGELDLVYQPKYDKLPTGYYRELTQEGQKQKVILDEEKKLRKHAIEDREQNALLRYEEEISNIEHKILLVKTQLLRELITRENSDIVFMINSVNPVGDKEEYKEIKSSNYFDLLKFLIREGYIDETYPDYMTYFYEESLTTSDKIFLRRITDRRGADYEYTVKEVQKILASPVLRVADFSEEETLNYDLLNGLLANQGIPKYKEYLTTLLNQLETGKKIDFISKYYDTEIFDDLFVEKLNEHWTGFFSYVLSNKLLPMRQLRRYSLDTLYRSDKQVLEQINVDNSLSNYISEQSDYLDIDSPEVEKIISQFKNLQISFKSIEFNKSNRALYDSVYEHDMYDLTFDNIELMLKTQYNATDSFDIYHKNYTLVRSNPNSPLATYIEGNMQLYLEEVLLKCDGTIEDDEEIVLCILNNENINDDTKIRYIEVLKTVISDITQIENVALWKSLVRKDILSHTAINIVTYYLEKGMDNDIVCFINKSDLGINFSHVEEQFGEKDTSNFYDDIVKNNDIKSNIYKKILNDIGYVFDAYDAVDIVEDKMRILIDEGLIQMSKESLEFTRTQYPKLNLYFIEHNLDSYLDIQTSDIAVYEEIVQILDFEFDDEKKIELLGFTSEEISVQHKGYSDELQAYIITNNLDKEDVEYLFQHYSKFEEKTRGAIYELSLSKIDSIIKNDIALSDKLLAEILAKSTYSTSVKIQLWERAIPRQNEEMCKVHFEELGVPELKGIFTKRNVLSKTYEKNGDVTAILEALKNNKWIYDYYEKEDDSEKYIVVKNPPKEIK